LRVTGHHHPLEDLQVVVEERVRGRVRVRVREGITCR
jgi:hypothetical protein